ncbi:MAG: glycosyltransferase, partial [Candidatus Kapabacteria bacterium]|nr:glycosyltransferase [Candidatus Kapabacteria bacterium]
MKQDTRTAAHIPPSQSQSGFSPVVTIVIVNYNVRDFLYQCLSSIERVHNTAPLRVIVVDNNSADDSIEYLQPQFPWVEFIPLPENIGFGRANNIGITKSESQYTLLLNPDTIIAEDTIGTMVRFMETNPASGIAGCKVLNADGTFQVQCRRGFPTPWASFCKLFGLQALFPNSPLFARYNQLYRSPDETYTVDAVIGAFMFCRTDALKSAGGFDPDYFMYGEDLDLCYRMKKAGYNTSYVHSTSIIHFKGESTRRSSMNEVRVFYDAMVVFARKHYGKSKIFLLFLRMGIMLRMGIAFMLRRKREFILMFCDMLIQNGMLLLATSLRFKSPFGFPDYAYPVVFIVLTAVLGCSMILSGEYFEYHSPSARRVVTGYLIGFFILSATTYYWNDFAFSRGVLLMTIGFSMAVSLLVRGLVALFDSFAGRQVRRIIVVGAGSEAHHLVKSILQADVSSVSVIGRVTALNTDSNTEESMIPVLGNITYLAKIVREHDVDEVVIADSAIDRTLILGALMQTAEYGVKYHVADGYDDLVVSRIINEVSDTGVLPDYPLGRFRNRLFKRLTDVVCAVAALLIVTPLVFLARKPIAVHIQTWLGVLSGSRSVIG